MDLSNLPTSLVSQLTGAVEGFIVANRKKYGTNAVPLTPAQKRAMQPFFSREILDQVKVVTLNGSRVEDPPFYAMAKMMGIRNLLSFSEVAAVTFVDVVVSHEPFSDTLLFHELVHVVQYAQMGSKEFASRYVRGFLKSGSYDGIPLEKNAYELEQRFISKGRSFSVADEVQEWVEAGRF
jgi:hypothetical protein